MPEGNLPPKAREIYLNAEKSAKKTCPPGDNHEECVARKSWAAVKRVFHKVGDKWVPKSEAEFSFFITKAYIDNDNQQMRWCAVNSDTDPDLYNDEMTLELYADFLARIENKELPPERHRSDFWSGGMPYLSVSHYLDQNGKAVPGEVQEIFVDGNRLKSKGIFYDTPIGKAAYRAVRENFADERKSEQNKVRISIAFVDWGHEHKSNGYKFVRESLDDLCPECINEMVTGKGEGKRFERGQLIHLALTRVPVNQRTIMEVEKMATQKDDAVSIIGDDLADELDKKALETKADLVIKSEDAPADPEPVVEEAFPKKDEKPMDEEDDEEDKKKKEEKKADIVEEISHVLDPALADFKAAYDAVVSLAVPSTEKLQQLQPSFNALAEHLKSLIQTPAEAKQEVEKAQYDELKALVVAQNDNIQALMQEVAILKQQGIPHQVKPQETVRRSIQIDPTKLLTAPSKPRTVKEIADASVFGTSYFSQ